MGKCASLIRLSDMNAQRTASNGDSPHHEPVPLPETPSVHAKEARASAPASFRRVSTKGLHEELSKPERPLSLDTGSFAPHQAPISSETGDLAIKSQSTLHSPASLPPPLNMSVVKAVPTTQSNKKKQFGMRVNGRAYTRIDCLGRRGSGKVYRVATVDGTVLALKRVSLEHMDELAEKGLKREIEPLHRLRGVERVIQLIDYEMNREKQSVFVVSIFALYRHDPLLVLEMRQLIQITAYGSWRTRLQHSPKEPPGRNWSTSTQLRDHICPILLEGNA